MKNRLTIFVSAAIFFLIPLSAGAMTLVNTEYHKNSDVTYKIDGKKIRTSAGEFQAQVRDDEGNFVNNGEWFSAFCVDPSQWAQIGGTLDVEFAAPSTVSGGMQAAWLFENRELYKSDHSVWSKYEATGLQLALWEVTQDYNNDLDFDLSDGDFSVVSANSYAKALANFYLDSLSQSFDPTGLDGKYSFSLHPSKQDFILGGISALDPPPVAVDTPEPATLLLLGLGLVGVFGLKRKSSK